MAKWVNVAAVQFTTKAARNVEGSYEVVVEETRARLAGLRGRGLDLVVTCEGIEAHAQTPELAERLEEPGPLLQSYADFAKAEACYVVGSAKVREDDRVYNSAVLFGLDGEPLAVYHKTFLTLGEIDGGLGSGEGAVTADTALGRIGFAICFDLNFSELRREYAALSPDLIAFPSMYHGGLMQGIWAYDCRAYFVSATYFHDCGIVDPFGRPVALADEYTATPIARINLDYELVHLDYNREKFDDIRKQYGHDITLDVPAHIGSALLASNSPDFTVADVVSEFDLVLLDDYFRNARERNAGNRE